MVSFSEEPKEVMDVYLEPVRELTRATHVLIQYRSKTDVTFPLQILAYFNASIMSAGSLHEG